MRLAGRHAMVTGAGRGIGLQIAKALALEGARLTLVGRSATLLQQASSACRSAGSPRTDISPRDLTERGALRGLAASIAGQIDILVNNAGAAPSAPLEQTGEVLWEQTFGLNSFAPFVLCKATLPGMLERGWGRVVNVASTAALHGYPYTSAYTASKHALLGLTRALDAEIRHRNPDADVSVNAVCPGFVDTELLKPTLERLVKGGASEAEAKERLGSMNPGGRLLLPEEVADAVVRLVCEQPAVTRGAAVELLAGLM